MKLPDIIPRHALAAALGPACAVAAVFTMFKALSLAAGTSTPVVVVTSQSMYPTFSRGDVLFLWNRTEAVRAGDIPVCWFPGERVPMVHRAISVHYEHVEEEEEEEGGRPRQLILTKGDNNPVDDTFLYPEDQEYVFREQVVGVVRGYLPYLGWIAILLRGEV